MSQSTILQLLPQTVYVKHSTKWTELEPKKKDEYDEYESKNKKDSWGPYY